MHPGLGIGIALAIGSGRVAENPVMRAITTDANDVMEALENGTVYTDVTRVGDNSGLEDVAAWRFLNLKIPFGAHIDSATFTVTAYPIRFGTGSLTFRAQDADNPAAIDGANKPSTWTTTTASTAQAAIALDPDGVTPVTGTASVAIAANNDDGTDVVSGSLWFADALAAGDSAGAEVIGGWRLTGVTVPFGATIDSATLTAECVSGGIGAGAVIVRAEDVDSGAAITDSHRPSGWTTTTASASIDAIGSLRLTRASISADANDGHEMFDEVAGTPISWSSTVTQVGDVAGNEGIAAFHFATLNVPFGATIESAVFYADSPSYTDGAGTVTWRAQDVDDASVPSASNYPHTWSVTTASASTF